MSNAPAGYTKLLVLSGGVVIAIVLLVTVDLELVDFERRRAQGW